MNTMTAEQNEQRQALLAMGYGTPLLDTFEPHEYAFLLQESLLEELNPEDEDA